jgi:hypothetical protein
VEDLAAGVPGHAPPPVEKAKSHARRRRRAGTERIPSAGRTPATLVFAAFVAVGCSTGGEAPGLRARRGLIPPCGDPLPAATRDVGASGCVCRPRSATHSGARETGPVQGQGTCRAMGAWGGVSPGTLAKWRSRPLYLA